MATVFRVCARRLCLAVVPVGGARSAGPACGACGRREVCGVWLWCLWAAAGPGAGLLAAMRGRREACGAWPGFETTRRAKLVCGDLAGGPPPTGATGRIKWAGLAPPGSVVAKLPSGSEVGRSSASGGVEVEEGY